MVNIFTENFPIFVQAFFCCVNKDAFILTQAGASVRRVGDITSSSLVPVYSHIRLKDMCMFLPNDSTHKTVPISACTSISSSPNSARRK